MNWKIATVCLSGLLFGCVPPPPPATAPPPPPPAPAAAPATPAPTGERIVSVRGARCERFIELSDEDRQAATMFYIGYQASRLRVGTVNVVSIPSIASLSMNYCLEHRDRPVAEAFAVGYRSYLRFIRNQ